jgi:histone deacetylase 1/2
MEERLRLSHDSTAPEVDSTKYTRPDLAFAVGSASRFTERPTEKHMKAVKRILRFVNGTLDYGLRYEKSTQTTWLAGYNDHADDIDNRKSTIASGNLFYLGKCPGNHSSNEWWLCRHARQSTLPLP